VPIGDTLAEARQRAGLTVAQVSEQTRIREAVITGIEGGDYFASGGDFYARANIRSIAKVVGADSGPLVAEYDALHRARGALTAVSLEELLATSAPAVVAPAQTLTPASARAPGRGGSGPPAPRATGGRRAAGPAHPAVHHRPLPEPVPQQRPAHERARPGHDHGRRDNHRRHAPAEKRLHPDLPRPE
jgi:hypothetical protein